jgi:hypothetical protein
MATDTTLPKDGPVDPFSAAGAAHISQITGQQPAPISANVLSTPALPPLPQPAQTSTPAAPPIPTLDSIFNTSDTPLDNQFKDTTIAESRTAADLAGETAFRTSQETANDLTGKKATVTDLTSRLNTLKSQADAIPLAVQNEFSGRGATVGGVTPFQTADLRNNTIQQLGVSAMLNAANGNLSTAQDQVDAAVKAKFDPLKAQLAAQQAQLAAITPLLDMEQKKQAVKQTAALAERTRLLTKQEDDQKTIYQTMLTAAQNGADAVTLRTIQNASTPDEAIAAAGTSLGAKFRNDQTQQEFDNNIKLAQLAIDQQKAKNDSAAATADPSQILAFAQQYASDGKIPAGLPKGTFGIVSQVAKELPKPEGTLVSNVTGIAPNNLSATQTDGIAALRDLQKKLDDAKTLYDSYHHGLLAGIKNAVAPSQGEQQYQNLRSEIVDLLARARTGAAISATEEATYSAKLPGNFNKSLFLGASGDTKIDSLKSSLSGKLDTTLQTHNVAIYGYSTVKLGGQSYTVGQIVTNDKGQQGRVNADGTITLIQ